MFAAELAKEMEKMMGGVKASDNSSASSTAFGPKKAGTAGAPSAASVDLDDEEKELLGDDKELQEAFERIMASAKMSSGSGDGSDLKDEDFNLEELSKLMSSLGAGGFPGLDSVAGPAQPSQISAAKSSKSPGQTSTASKGPSSKPQNFNETLQATMSRLADSEAQHKSRSASKNAGHDPNDPLAALMAQMEAMGGLGGKDGDDDENLPELLDGLMDQLMSKELLQEPIAELKDKVRWCNEVAS